MKPYETIQELLEAAKIHGPYVKLSGGRYYLIAAIYELGENTWSCVLSGPKRNLTPQEFLTECTWQDGFPCGKPNRSMKRIMGKNVWTDAIARGEI